MASNRRAFLQTLSQLSGALLLSGSYSPAAAAISSWAEKWAAVSQAVENQPPEVVATDEDYWAVIQQAYTTATNIINLNNGGVSPQPLIVQQALERYNQLANEAPTYTMWRQLDQGREPLRKKLAKLAGVDPEEIAICRNTTEALDLVIFGLELKAGDEVIVTKQDYPNMINAWKQRERRDGIKLVWLDLNLPSEDENYLANAFIQAFTSKTRVVHITQMINWTGQILPTAKIAAAARAKGIEVIVDGAHTFAHLDYKIPDLQADYFGTSLHKWLSAPFGTGLLWVRKNKIKDLYALFPNHLAETDDIRKFEGLGTRSIPIEQAIGIAINFHESIGSARKEARLRYLKNYWASQAAKLPGVQLLTPLHEKFSCALANFSVEGMTPTEMESFLFEKYKIHTVAIDWENIHGLRVTPHVYTRIADLDLLLEGIAAMNKHKK
jgi:selenocysteine lyase/cysteine desulfurase